MSSSSITASGVSRRAFESLVLLWLALFAITFAVAVIFFVPKTAHAMDPLPFPKMAREIAPAEIKSFTSFPSPAVKSDRCSSLLQSASRTNGQKAFGGRDRRPAGSSDVQMVAAVRAYRQCKSKEALALLADWRWSR